VHQYVFDQEAADLGFGNRLTDSYDAAIHWVDSNVGRVVQELENRKLLPRTIVVVASDHGEGFDTHGEGHARTLYREVAQVPWLMALPMLLPKDVVVQPMVRNVDIWPTLYDLLGLPPVEPSDGKSAVPLIEAALSGAGPEANGTSSIAFLDRTWGARDEAPKPLVSVTSGGKRFIRLGPEQIELYDDTVDPRNQKDLAKEQPETVAKLRSEADQVLGEKPAWGETPKVELDEMYLDQLRALGYVVK
jgi:arylsulfatase A-like enzyme